MTFKKILIKLIVDNGIGADNKKLRDNWVEAILKKIPKGGSILDAGAGEMPYKIFCNHLNYTSQDFAKYDGEGNQTGLQTGSFDNSKLDIISDISSIPRKNESFDAIMCTEVLEHVPDPNRIIKEFSRLLKKNGKLIITAPFCSLTHFAPYHFSTGFNKYFYEEVLKTNEFKILEIIPNGNYFEYIAQEIRRLPSIAMRYSNHKTNYIEKIFFKLMLVILNKYNKKDTISSELLCFGYHVLAEKIK